MLTVANGEKVNKNHNAPKAQKGTTTVKVNHQTISSYSRNSLKNLIDNDHLSKSKSVHNFST